MRRTPRSPRSRCVVAEGVATVIDAIQQYLLGYEFPSTLIVFHRSPRKITFIASKTKSGPLFLPWGRR